MLGRAPSTQTRLVLANSVVYFSVLTWFTVGMLEAVHTILAMMEKFYPRKSFFSFQGDQNVLFYPFQTVYSMFISDAQKVASSPEIDLILYFALGR